MALKYRVTQVMIDCPNDWCNGYMTDDTWAAHFDKPSEHVPGHVIRCDTCGFLDKMPKVKGFND